MEVVANNYVPGDQRLVDKIVYELKSQGVFDHFRKECFADVDTKPAYQNLRQRVEGSVSGFLKDQSWRPDMNKNQVREMLRRKITESGYLETGVERIVDQVVNPKINTVFLPRVEEIVYSHLGIQKPNRLDSKSGKSSVEASDLLPSDLEAVSPESESVERKEDKSSDTLQDLDDSKVEEDESPPFEPLEEQSVYVPQEENSVDSHMSGFSGLVSHESNQSNDQKPTQIDFGQQDSQMSRNSSDSRLSIVTSDDNSKMDICEDSQSKSVKSTDSNQKSEDKSRTDKHKSSDKHKSRSEGKSDRKDDKDRKNNKDSKSHHNSSHKDKDKKRDSKSSTSRSDRDGKSDKGRDRSRSSSSKHPSSKDKVVKKESNSSSSKDKDSSSSSSKDKDKNRSSSSSKDLKSKPSDSKKSSSSHRKDDKHGSHNDKSSSSKRDKDRKKDSKSKDDHYSSKDKKNDRRSTDRDSNDGQSSKPTLSTPSEPTTSNSQRNESNNNLNNGGGDSGNSDQGEKRSPVVISETIENSETLISPVHEQKVKLLKPKCASNLHEALKLMKIRKQLAKLEKQNQLSLASVEVNPLTLISSSISLEELSSISKEKFLHQEVDESEVVPSPLRNTVISQDNWDTMEAKLRQEVSSEFSEFEEGEERIEANEEREEDKRRKNEVGESDKCLEDEFGENREGEDNIDSMEEGSGLQLEEQEDVGKVSEEDKSKVGQEDNICSHFEKVDLNKIPFLQFANDYIRRFDLAQHAVESPKTKSLRKRPVDDGLSNNNNNKITEKRRKVVSKKSHPSSSPVVQHNQTFLLPLSPAESDKSVGKKDETTVVPPVKPKRSSINKANSQRYSSDDLYKPRLTFINSRRRGAKNEEN